MVACENENLGTVIIPKTNEEGIFMRRKRSTVSKYAYILNKIDLYLAIGYSNMVSNSDWWGCFDLLVVHLCRLEKSSRDDTEPNLLSGCLGLAETTHFWKLAVFSENLDLQ